MAPSDALSSVHAVPAKLPVRRLDVATAFAGLTPTEALYAHYFAAASWQGALACLHQARPCALPKFALLCDVFVCCWYFSILFCMLQLVSSRSLLGSAIASSTGRELCCGSPSRQLQNTAS